MRFSLYDGPAFTSFAGESETSARVDGPDHATSSRGWRRVNGPDLSSGPGHVACRNYTNFA